MQEQNASLDSDIMEPIMATIGLIAYCSSLFGFYMWGYSHSGSDQGQEILNNSTILSESKKTVSTWFFFTLKTETPHYSLC